MTTSPVGDRPRPRPNPTSQRWWDGLRAERVDLQRCRDCGTWIHYPRLRCSSCLGSDLEWRTVAGTGVVHTFTVAPVPTLPSFADDLPQCIAIVQLDEGVRVTTTLVGVDPSAIRIGMPVLPVFDHGDDGITLLRFRPAD